nr:hypothetical protein [Opitutaceae bacterium]
MSRALALLAGALLVAPATAPAATITVSPTVIGQTPSVLGYNLGHFMPGSNAADWWRYSGVKHARVFMPRNGIEFSDDLAGIGDGVTDETQFFERRAALRADPLTRVVSPTTVPPHLRSPFIGWPYLETKYRRDIVGGFNRYIVDPTFTALRAQGVDILMQLSAYPSSFPIASPDDWAGNWELWQHYYFQAYYLAWKYDVSRWSA